eukprot:750339-Hanusia_phi.AAC.1
MSDQHTAELLDDVRVRSRRIEQLYNFLPVCWRKSKFRIVDLKNAAQYNGIECITKGVDPGSGRIMTRLLNEAQNELLIKYENLELVQLNLDEEKEPVLCKAKERLGLSSSSSVPMTKDGVASSCVNLTQALLDVTFAIENNMVDDDFSNKALFKEVGNLLRGLDSVRRCLRNLSQILDVLRSVEELCFKFCHGYDLKVSNGILSIDRLQDGLTAHRCRNGGHERDSRRGDGRVHSLAEGIRKLPLQAKECKCPSDPGQSGLLMTLIANHDRLNLRCCSHLKKYLYIVNIMTKAGPNSVGSGWDTGRAQSLIEELQDHEKH